MGTGGRSGIPAPAPAAPSPAAGEAAGLRHRLEAWGAGLVFTLFRLLPVDRASALGGAIARHVGPRLGISNRARRNLRAALPGLSQAEIERIVAQMWDNLGRVAAEYPHLQQLRVFPAGGRVETAGVEHVDRALAAGRRIILFGGHLANWEIAPLAARQYGMRSAQIFRAANNPLVDRMIARYRGTGIFVPKGSVAARAAIDVLRRGGHLGLLVDQKMNDGIAVPFFGRPAMTAPALAQLALRFDCTVLPTQVERLGGVRFRLTVHPPLPLPNSGDRQADIAMLMAAVNAALESWIRERPGQWFWLHRRWPAP